MDSEEWVSVVLVVAGADATAILADTAVAAKLDSAK